MKSSAKRRVRPRIGWLAKVRITLRRKDARYSGGLVAGAKILELFGDAATKLCLRETRGKSEGLLRAYQDVEFLKPVHAGDTVEAIATIIRVGNTSRTMKFAAYRLIPKRVLVAKAIGTVVVRNAN
jgi:3-aminobutyryl-CoA ammonia-lyase